jgi:hypothetical protein
MPQKKCSVDTCQKPSRKRGWCPMHYERWRQHGTVDDPLPRPERECSVEECGKSVHGRGWCTTHYQRWEAHGTTDLPVKNQPTPEERRRSDLGRFWSFVRKRERQACWVWFGHTDRDGYGTFWFDGKNVLAHRFSYELHTGKGLGDKLIDHRCHKTYCVNPAHLRPVTNKQNQENRKGSRSKTGVRGVAKRNDNRFEAQFEHNGKGIYVGSFRTLEEAERAIIAARCEVFTHNDVDRLTG